MKGNINEISNIISIQSPKEVSYIYKSQNSFYYNPETKSQYCLIDSENINLIEDMNIINYEDKTLFPELLYKLSEMKLPSLFVVDDTKTLGSFVFGIFFGITIYSIMMFFL